MFTKDAILTLYHGTHECLDLVVHHAAILPPALFSHPVPGFGAGTVRDQLVHVLSVEAAWISALQHLPIVRLSSDDFPSAAALVPKKRQVMATTLSYIHNMDEAALNQLLPSYPPEWNGPHRSPAFIVAHVVTHAFHHKGQIATMFRMLGHPIGDTDLQRV
jgi:uncharacterized damage-inducible protein DinB